eukprot:7065112-Prymnesium_polylepis.1
MGESAAALFAKGAALMAQKKWAEAVEMLRSAVAKDEGLTGAWTELGRGLFYLKDYDGAEAAARRALEIDPMSSAAHARLGAVAGDHRKDHDGEEAAYRKAIELDPTYATPHYNLGLLLTDVRKDHDGAEA